MFFLIKIILILAILSGVFIYGDTIWEDIKEKVFNSTNPELQRANILESLKTNFSDIEAIIQKVNENLDNPNFDKKTQLTESLKLIEQSKESLEKIEKTSDSSLIEQTFEAARDLKKGIQNLIFPELEDQTSQTPFQTSPDCQCSQ